MASLVLGISCFTFSCKNKKNLSLERQLLQEEAAGVLSTDTFQVNVEAVRIDSPSTKNKFHLTVGSFIDNGSTITTEAYGQFTIAVGGSTLAYDTLKGISLKFDPDLVLGDVSAGSKLSFDVHLLTETIDASKDYKISSKVGYDPIKLASFDFSYYDSIQTVKLEGAALDKIKGILDGLKGKSDAEFRVGFKGLAFIPTSINTYAATFRTGNALGFQIQIDYKNASDTELRSYILSIVDKIDVPASQRFTRATQTSVPFIPEGIGSRTLFNNTAYINDMMGVRAKVSIPGLNQFVSSIKGKYNIMEASLVVPSSNLKSQDVINPYTYLYIIECKDDGSPATWKSGNWKILQNELNGSMQQTNIDTTGNEAYIPYNNQQRRFEYPMGHYVKAMLKGQRTNTSFITSLMSYDYNYFLTSTPASYTFGTKDALGGKIKFVVYYNQIAQ